MGMFVRDVLPNGGRSIMSRLSRLSRLFGASTTARVGPVDAQDLLRSGGVLVDSRGKKGAVR